MKTRIRSAFAVLTFTSLAATMTASAQRRIDDEPQYRVRIETADAAGTLTTLERAGYDILGTSPEGTAIELAVSVTEWHALRRDGFHVVAVERGRPLQDALDIQSSGRADGALQATAALVPATYRDLDGVVARMQDIADAYPAIAQFVDLTSTYNTPPTVEGRHMFALKLSDNVATDEDEPGLLIAATHHAREIVTPVIALDAAERLTAGYGTDPRITAAVDSHEIWIAPVWNPDGYSYVFSTNNLWRKNRRVFPGGTGVDQNRNYQQGWTAPCSGSTNAASETYKGPSPASEAETQTMMAWSETERFAKVIDYHSSGREVLYGYRCLGHPFTAWLRQEAAALSLASGYAGHTRLPSAEGEHQQWQMARLGAYAFLIETHTEFQPSYASALNEAAMVWPGILRVLERPVSVTGHVTDAATGLPLAARIEILNVAFPNGETNSSGGPFGSYNMFLPPGTYDLRFSGDGYGSVVRQVTVEAASSTVVDVALSTVETVFADDFETDTGWTPNPFGTDTAATGAWERGDPQPTSSSGPKQLGTTVSGVNDLVTGRLSGVSAGTHDLDGGRTSIRSAPIALPAAGGLTMTFSYYLAHGTNSSSADYLRISIVGATTTTVFQELGAANDDDGAWAVATVDLTAFAGQTVQILVEAADAAGASLVEAGLDDVKIVRQ